jgi:hypothetical protein
MATLAPEHHGARSGGSGPGELVPFTDDPQLASEGVQIFDASSGVPHPEPVENVSVSAACWRVVERRI